MAAFTEDDLKAMRERIRAKHGPAIVLNKVVRAKGRTEKRHPKPVMNGVEAAYAMLLEAEKRAGRIVDYKFEGVTIRLGDDCRFTPDFFVIDCDGLVQFHDCKAIHRGKSKPHVEDDAKVKLSVAASTIFPYFEFRIVWQLEGLWQRRVI